MLLVPRQLLRSGMTGNVPYYGGRLSPAQAYAASHPAPGHPAPARPAPTVPPRTALATGETDPAAALRDLRDSGVLSAEEYAQLMARVGP